MAGFDLTTWLNYIFFAVCLLLGWGAAGALDFTKVLRHSTSRWVRFLLRLGVTLVLAEGFRVFLSFALGPLLDMFVYQSISGFKAY